MLGKAVPEDDDTASLIVQLRRRLADRSGVDFRAHRARRRAAARAPPPAAAAADRPPTARAARRGGDGAADDDPRPPRRATEAAAATLPIGATVGPAGLPVMPYDLDFRGDFFEIADFIAELDGMVRTDADGDVGVDGRLLTVDGFGLTRRPRTTGFPPLDREPRT